MDDELAVCEEEPEEDEALPPPELPFQPRD
jgi:hypothetical protein